MSLRWIALAALLASCGGAVLEDSRAGELAGNVRVRVAAANLTTGTRQTYDAGEGIRILQGIRPDVALVQELNYGANGEADVRAFVDRAFGPSFSVAREPTAGLPNGVVSRHPIRASGAWADASVSNRSFVWARLDVPGPRDLWAVSVHFLASNATRRVDEGRQLAELIRANVPAGDYVVVGGDLNTSSRAEESVTALSAVVDVAAPWPADAGGNANTSAARSKPLDWVLVNAPLRALEAAVSIGASIFPSGLVVDSRVYSPLAEIAPAQQGDSGAANMQHMAVVRDFLFPADAPPPPDTRFEPDDSAAAAKAIEVGGAAQIRDIAPRNDQDWVAFTLPTDGPVTISTDGPSGGDTYLRLFDQVQRQIAWDDDSGPGYYSRIYRGSLPAGTYHVQVTSYRGLTTIQGYSLRVVR